MSAIPPGFLPTGITGVTWNPADTHADITLTNGRLTLTKGASNNIRSSRATVGLDATTAAAYFEVIMQGTETTSNFRVVGVGTSATALTSYPGGDSVSWGYYEQTGQKFTNNTGASYGTTYTNGDVISVALKNGSLWFAKNNTWQNSGNPAANTGAAFTGLTGTVYPMVELYKGTSPVHIMTGRFAVSDFSYSPPSGFVAWA